MTARKRSDRKKDTLPRREVVEVFKTLRLDEPSELRRMEELGGLGQFDQKPPTYYTIEVTGTLEYTDCALSV
jgi:hypothetical protein